MNVFFLNRSPDLAAEALCNKHLGAAIREAAQILCDAHRLCGTPEELLPYRRYNPNHPCPRWAASGVDQFNWLLTYGEFLDVEWQHRFGKQHKSGAVIRQIAELPIPTPVGEWADPPQVFGDWEHLRGPLDDEAYRRYYAIAKADVCGQYTNRTPPAWLGELRAQG